LEFRRFERDGNEIAGAFVGRQHAVAARPTNVADGRYQCPVVAPEQRVLSGAIGRRGRGHARSRDAVSRGGHPRPHDAVRVSQRAHVAVLVAAHVAVLAADRAKSSVLRHQHQHRRISAPAPAADPSHAPAATRTVSATAVLAGQGQRGRGRSNARDGQTR